MEKERNQQGWHSWGAVVASAADRDGWRNLLAGLKSPHGPDEDKVSRLKLSTSRRLKFWRNLVLVLS